MQRQAAMQHLDFSRPYETQRKMVLSEQPVLPTKIEIERQDGTSLLVFRIHAPNGRFAAMPMEANLHAGLTELLKKAVAQADWDMGLSVKPTATPTPAGMH